MSATAYRMTKANVGALNSAIELANELFHSGSITAEERQELLDSSLRDVTNDNASRRARYELNPHQQDPKQFEEQTVMDTKTIIRSIERNRELMGAQMEKLDSTPASSVPIAISPNSDMQTSVGELLSATVRAHLQASANTLNTLAEVERQFRSSSLPNEAAKPNREPKVIDAEVTVLPPSQ